MSTKKRFAQSGRQPAYICDHPVRDLIMADEGLTDADIEEALRDSKQREQAELEQKFARPKQLSVPMSAAMSRATLKLNLEHRGEEEVYDDPSL